MKKSVAPICIVMAISIAMAVIFLPGCKTESNNASANPGLAKIHLKIRDKVLLVEVAATIEARENGLMHRTSLDKDTGMLFIFPRPEKLSFWMHDTVIPLSIAFIDEKGVIAQIESMEPLDEKSIVSKTDCQYALEVVQGWYSESGIKAGDKIDLSAIQPKK